MQQTSRKAMKNQEQKRNLLHRNQELQKRASLGEGAPLRGPQRLPPGQRGTQHSRALWEEGPCGIPRVPQGKLKASKTLSDATPVPPYAQAEHFSSTFQGKSNSQSVTVEMTEQLRAGARASPKQW